MCVVRADVFCRRPWLGMLSDMSTYEIMVRRATHGELAATGFRMGGVNGLVGIKSGSQNT